MMLVAVYLTRIANKGTLSFIHSVWERPSFIFLYIICNLKEVVRVGIDAEDEPPLLLLRNIRFVRLRVLVARTRELIRAFSFVFRDINFTRILLLLLLIIIATSAATHYAAKAGHLISSYWSAPWFTKATITGMGHGDIALVSELDKTMTLMITVISMDSWTSIIASLGTVFNEIAQRHAIGKELKRFERRIKVMKKGMPASEKEMKKQASRALAEARHERRIQASNDKYSSSSMEATRLVIIKGFVKFITRLKKEVL
ncbi:MAG: hypothetical protein ABWW69_00885 [Pyrodictiaceae archaeon]